MKKFKGIVISTKMQRTACVKVNRLVSHPVYKKIMKKSKKYLCDNEIKAKENEAVVIQECRPISKKKKFKIVEIIRSQK